MEKLSIDPKAKALIFDIDGTLVDTMDLHYKACQVVCLKRGFEFPYQFFLDKAGIPTTTVFKMLLDDLSRQDDPLVLSEEKEEEFLKLLPAKPMPGVFDIAKHYKGKLPMALGTGGTMDVAGVIIDALEIRNWFDAFVTADQVSHPKPHPETFLECAKRMGIAPEECQVFEDGDPGVEAGLAAGMIVTDIRKYTLEFEEA